MDSSVVESASGFFPELLLGWRSSAPIDIDANLATRSAQQR